MLHPFLGFAIALALLSVSGCAEERIWKPTTHPALQTKAEVDQTVIETVLVDLATSSDSNAVQVRKEQRLNGAYEDTGKLLFSGVGRTGQVGTLGQALAGASEKWKVLGWQTHESALDAAAVVKWRVKQDDTFTPFRPTDRRLQVWEDLPESKLERHDWTYQGPRTIHLSAPGYSDDGDIAVVYVAFRWSEHSGDIVCLLQFDGTHWNVLSREFSFYP